MKWREQEGHVVTGAGRGDRSRKGGQEQEGHGVQDKEGSIGTGREGRSRK
jgi:hypothetical protein